MLPFLKNKQEGSISSAVKNITPNEEPKQQDYNMLESAAMELIIAVHLKDVKAVCVALQSAFEIMESLPHHEGEHF